MATHAIKFLQGFPGYKPQDTYMSALDPTATSTATATDLSYVNPVTLASIVFHGSFVVVGGVVTGGTATGFDLYANQTAVVHGTNFSIASTDLVAAIAAAQAFDVGPLFEIIYTDTDQTGTSANDVMLGYSGLVRGLGGDDELTVGFDGNITLLGGKGDDQLDGGIGNTQLYGGQGDDLIFADGGTTLAKGGEGDDRLNVAFSVLGTPGPITLYGNKGDDILATGGLAATLFGGKGDDFFAFRSLGTVTVLADFNPKHDTIGLKIGGVFDNIPAGAFTDAQFVTGAAATTPEQRIVYNNLMGQVFYDQDGSGGSYAPIHFATLTNLPQLTANDFVGYFALS